jgi:hypothetical protein
MKFRWIVFIIFYFINLNAEKNIDIAKDFHKRSQQYPLNEYKKICVNSPSRVGSTLIFNVLKILFDNDEVLSSPGKMHYWENNNLPDAQNVLVFKSHSFMDFDSSTVVFCPVRNPIDTCFSIFRVTQGNKKDQNIDEDHLVKVVNFYLGQMHGVQNLIKQNNCILLKYEDFVDNLDFIFHKCEDVFNIKIQDVDKNLIKQILSRENVMLSIKDFKDFSACDETTYFHGLHINASEFSPEQEVVIKEKIKEQLSEKFDFLNNYGYTL